MNPLYPYQQDCYNKVQEGYVEGFKKQLLILPTGGGKTEVFSHLAHNFASAGHRALILVHRDELVNQAVKTLAFTTGMPVGIEKADNYATRDFPLVVASVQSLQNSRLAHWPKNHFQFVVADEAHHSLAPSWQAVLQHFDNFAKILGVTATPDRSDKKRLGHYYENIAAEIGLLELIETGYLSDIHVQSIPIPINLSDIKASSETGDFEAHGASAVIVPLLEKITDAIVDVFHQTNRKRLLTFLPLVDTSKYFAELLTSKGIPTIHIDGKSPNRKEILAAYEAGEITSISNSDLLMEGYDCKPIDMIVPLKPTRSTARFSQITGRGTRLHENKDFLLLLDFLWQHERHKIIRPPYLLGANAEIQEEMQKVCSDPEKAHNLREIQESAIVAQEAKLAREIARQARRREQTFSLKEASLILHNPDLGSYEPTMPWHSDPVTEKQQKILDNLKRFQGIDTDEVKTKGHASFIITTFQAREKLASPKQVKWLKSLGTETPHTLTKEEATAIISRAQGVEPLPQKKAKKPKKNRWTPPTSPSLEL